MSQCHGLYGPKEAETIRSNNRGKRVYINDSTGTCEGWADGSGILSMIEDTRIRAESVAAR